MGATERVPPCGCSVGKGARDAAPLMRHGEPVGLREGLARTERVEVAEGGTVALLCDGEAEAVDDWLREATTDPVPHWEGEAVGEWVTAVSISYRP